MHAALGTVPGLFHKGTNVNYTDPPKTEWRRRVNENCKACIYDPCVAGDWRQQVELCTCTGCPIWEIRPISSTAADQSLLRILMKESSLDSEVIDKCPGQKSPTGPPRGERIDD